ncbi:MAG: hypothetical protein ACREM2_00270 [Vulcanimicrobiaceae bacterium]
MDEEIAKLQQIIRETQREVRRIAGERRALEAQLLNLARQTAAA